MDKLITGAMLRKMVVSGANYLEENKEYVNALNVFPVSRRRYWYKYVTYDEIIC